MKKTFQTLAMAVMLAATTSAQAQVKLNPNNIDEVIAAMTNDEKVDLIIGCGQANGGKFKFPGTAGLTRDFPRLGIKSSYFADGPMFLVMAKTRDWDSNLYYTTEFPGGPLLAASFDDAAVTAVGKAIGAETSDYGLDILLAPGANIVRSTLGGRNHEYYSEDPLLAGKMAAAYIRGVQSMGVGTSLKHFAVNSQETNRNTVDERASQRALREIFLKNFEIAVKESQPWTIMTSYNKFNGIYTCENPELTETLLRDEWGYTGVVMSDWNAGRDAVASVKAGNDMLQPGQKKQRDAIMAAINDGTLNMNDVDRNVKRILQMVVKTNSFSDYKYPNETDLKGHAAVAREVGANGMVLMKNANALPLAAGKNVALYGVTSYDLVPAGMGFGATNRGFYQVSLVEGLTKQGFGVDMGLAEAYKKHLAAEEKRLFPNGRPPFSITCPERAAETIPTAAELETQVKANDVAILSLGRTSGEGGDRHRKEFILKDGEKQLIDAVSAAYHKAGKKVIVLLNVCSPIETASWKDSVDGILCIFQPGAQIGNSTTDVLAGKVNPSGRLPQTWQVNYGDAPADDNFPADYVFDMEAFRRGFSGAVDKDAAERTQKAAAPELKKDIDYANHEEGIYVGYRYFSTFGKNVSYPFGYGLSYTTFGYEIQNSNIEGDRCTMQVKVTNTGKVPGKNVVQMYVTAPKGTMDKPSRELKAYAKTKVLKPGESQVVTLIWNLMDMASFNEKASAWELAKGTYQLQICENAEAAPVATATQNIAKVRLDKVNNILKPQAPIAVHPAVKRK